MAIAIGQMPQGSRIDYDGESRNEDKYVFVVHIVDMLLLLLSHFSRVKCDLCDPIDGSPPGSPIPGILQAKTLEWVAISFSNA